MVRVDEAQWRRQRGDECQLGLAHDAPVDVRLDGGALGVAELFERVGAERLADLPVVVVVHGSTPISSMASRKAFRP
jgi:hypothetical protein